MVGCNPNGRIRRVMWWCLWAGLGLADFSTAAEGPVGAPVTIVSGAIQPHLAIGADGAVYVVMIHQGNIAVSVSRDEGTSFGSPVVAIDVKGRARGGAHRGPRIGVDMRHRLTVTAPVTFDEAETRRRYPTAELYVTQSVDGGRTWTAPLQVNEVSKQAPEALHWMVVAPGGETHIAWLDMRARQEHGQDIYYSRLIDGKLTANQRVASTVCECCAPGLAVDPLGNPLLAYREGGSKPSREIFTRRSTDGGRHFTDAIQVNRTNTREETCPMSAPAVAVSVDGKRTAIAWKDIRTGEPNVYWSVSEQAPFGEERLVHESTEGIQNHPSLTFDKAGRVWVAWDDRRDKLQQVWVRASAPAGGMEKGIAISDASESPAGYPVIAAGERFVAIVYESKPQDEKLIQFRRMAGAQTTE